MLVILNEFAQKLSVPEMHGNALVHVFLLSWPGNVFLFFHAFLKIYLGGTLFSDNLVPHRLSLLFGITEHCHKHKVVSIL